MKPTFYDNLHPQIKWAAIRQARNVDLAACDYAVMPDSPLSVADLDAVKVYRQALRDLPEQGADPDGVVWPDKPACLK
ncbi:hypothetical protein D3C85_511120 [compost metagenome]